LATPCLGDVKLPLYRSHASFTSRSAAGAESVESGAPIRPRAMTGQLIVGISGARRNAAVAACGVHWSLPANRSVSPACGRAARARLFAGRGGYGPEAGRRAVSADVRYAVAEDATSCPPGPRPVSSIIGTCGERSIPPFERAVVFVCDRHSATQSSVWVADGDQLWRYPLPGAAAGFASLYSEFTEALASRAAGVSPGGIG
jgi:hypothetical protein